MGSRRDALATDRRDRTVGSAGRCHSALPGVPPSRSHDGAVNLGITTEEAAVTGRELFLRCLDQAIAVMLELAERAAALTA